MRFFKPGKRTWRRETVRLFLFCIFLFFTGMLFRRAVSMFHPAEEGKDKFG